MWIISGSWKDGRDAYSMPCRHGLQTMLSQNFSCFSSKDAEISVIATVHMFMAFCVTNELHELLSSSVVEHAFLQDGLV